MQVVLCAAASASACPCCCLLSPQLLTIKGQHVERTKVREEGGFTRSERTRRSFSRSFTLPDSESWQQPMLLL